MRDSGIRRSVSRRLRFSILRHDVHPVLQFLKYGIAGCIAASVDIAAFFLLAVFVFPALRADDAAIQTLARLYEWMVTVSPGLADSVWLHHAMNIRVPPISETAREYHFVLNRCLSFILANLTAYWLNRRFVFLPGRHSIGKEALLFNLVSILSFMTGTCLGWAIIAGMGTDTSLAYLVTVITSVLINFLLRKYVVFAG